MALYTGYNLANGGKRSTNEGVEVGPMYLSPMELDALRRIVWRLKDAGGKPTDVVRTRAIEHLYRAIVVAESKRNV